MIVRSRVATFWGSPIFDVRICPGLLWDLVLGSCAWFFGLTSRGAAATVLCDDFAPGRSMFSPGRTEFQWVAGVATEYSPGRQHNICRPKFGSSSHLLHCA